MSRIGKKPVHLADGAKLEVKDRTVVVSGPKGTLDYTVPECLDLKLEDRLIRLERTDETANSSAMQGLARSLIQGMVTGVTVGFRKVLEIHGVGFRGKCQGRKLVLNLGFSHPIEFEVPETLNVSMPNPTQIVIEGPDKQLVGQAAATIRGFYPPDSYKGKGIRYDNERISLKEGKTVG